MNGNKFRIILNFIPLGILCLFSVSSAEKGREIHGVYLPPDERPIYLELGKTPTDYRNVALDPVASADEMPVIFPHATSNSEYNKREFAARNAIDGIRLNNDVHTCGSWGPKKEPNIWWRLDFGRPVEIDKLVLYMRAAWQPENNPHDWYWKEATVDFSDGSHIKLDLKKIEAGQEFRISKRTVRWLILKNLRSEQDRWQALCEFEAWGRDAPIRDWPQKRTR